MKKMTKKKRLLAELCIYLALILLFAFAVPRLLIQRTVIDGSSMEPALHDGESVLVEKLSVRTGRMERFDIIVFSPEGTPNGRHYVKRIIGLPGETVQIAGGRILIDGQPLDESYG
ncbi:MAG: signal peptidase I, partial [Lachnospiraceae bacterium]|nr:signal peptidase I [Lachnospiraceae bacterium]